MVSRLYWLWRVIRATEGLVAVVVTLGAAVDTGQLTTFGRSTGQDFYVAVAQVIPIFLLALLVEASGQFGGFETEAREQGELEQQLAKAARDARESIERVKADSRRLEQVGDKVEGELATTAEQLIRASEEVIANAEAVADISAGLSRVGGAVRRILLGYVAAAIPGEAAALYAWRQGRAPPSC
jgi:hypothetical protein